jgi:hypothetical protein
LIVKDVEDCIVIDGLALFLFLDVSGQLLPPKRDDPPCFFFSPSEAVEHAIWLFPSLINPSFTGEAVYARIV